MRYRVLVTDEIDPDGLALLTADSRLQVDEVPTLPAAELLARIPEYDAIVGRSASRISGELLRAATRLRVVGRAGVGVDNVDMATATELGVAVINAPAGNTIAVAELLFGSLLALFRHIVRADTSMHAGRWDRSALLGNELKGRTLGIVGVGRIGSEVAMRAHAFGMDVIGYDPYVGDERFRALKIQRAPSLEALLPDADILTLHTPLTPETTGMIGRRELSRMPSGSVLCNLARGGIVDDGAPRPGHPKRPASRRVHRCLRAGAAAGGPSAPVAAERAAHAAPRRVDGGGATQRRRGRLRGSARCAAAR